MAPHRQAAPTFDDVQVLGAWNFTLQSDTPLYWLRSGVLDKYHMKFKVTSGCPSTWGIVLHAEADSTGTDGVSFWVERRKARDEEEPDTRRYLLSGQGLDSKPIITKTYQDHGRQLEEEVEIMMQGYTGAIMLQNRKIQLNFRLKHDRGSVAFYNSTQADVDDVHFAGVRITAIRRGPLEIAGMLSRVERSMLGLNKPLVPEEEPEARPVVSSLEMPSQEVTGGSTMLGPQASVTFSAQSLQSQKTDTLKRVSFPPASPGGSRQMLRPSASEGVLKNSGNSLVSASPVNRTRQLAGKNGMKWVAQAVNPHASEQKLIQDSMGPIKRNKNACSDFIVM